MSNPTKALAKSTAAIEVKEVADLQRMVDVESARREIITKFITDHMKDGTDFGRIHISKTCSDKWNCTYAKNPGHFSKPSLFKAGGEKFSSLMKIRPTFKKDVETYEMAGSIPGLFCYLCELLDPKGHVVGEGRGAASIQEKGTPNVAIKIAMKRAQVDAVLRTGGLSDFFTQDLEDMDLDKSVEPKTYTAPAPQQQRTSSIVRPPQMMTEVQKTNILKAIAEAGKTVDDLNAFTQKVYRKDFVQLTLTEASYTLNRVRSTAAGKRHDEVTNGYKAGVDAMHDKKFEGGSHCTFALTSGKTCSMAITKAVKEYSRNIYGADLCLVHQKLSKKIEQGVQEGQVVEEVDPEEIERGIEQQKLEEGQQASKT